MAAFMVGKSLKDRRQNKVIEELFEKADKNGNGKISIQVDWIFFWVGTKWAKKAEHEKDKMGKKGRSIRNFNFCNNYFKNNPNDYFYPF